MHRTTDPACTRFAGTGTVHRVLGIRIPSLRRILYNRGRGRSCEHCHNNRLRRAGATSSFERYFSGWTPRS